MKKLLLTLVLVLSLSFLWGQSVVRVAQIDADYAVPSVTFRVYWEGGVPDNILHLDSVWLFVDYQPVASNGSVGAWTAATLTGSSATAPATVVTGSLNGRGFYLRGTLDPTFSATVTVTLTGPTPGSTFNWCAYASDYPPNAIMQAGGGYALHGTPPFVINGSTREPSYTFDDAGVCITSITDSTGCPGFVVNTPIVPGSIPSTGETVCAGGTPATIVGLMPFGGGDGQLAYSWYKDGVPIVGATDADYTPPPADAATAGTYVYTRKVNDRTCGVAPLASDGSWRLTVEEVPTVTTTGPARCGNGTVTLTATPANATTPATYTWFVGNATSFTMMASIGATTYATPSLAVGSTYNVTIRNSTGCVSETAYGTVTINAVPTVSASSPTRCEAGTVSLTATPTGATSPATYSWIVGGAAAVTTTTNTYTTGSLNGNTTYSVSIRNSTGCSSTAANGTVTVHTASTLPTALTASTTTLCSGSAVTLTASGGALGSSASYQFGTDNYPLTTTTATTYAHSPTANTTYWVRIYTTSACAAPSGSATCTINVISPAASGETANACGCDGYLNNCSGTCLCYCSTPPIGADWTTCSSVSSDVDSYTGNTHSGFTQISSENFENCTIMNWSTANAYCASKGTGWRLPTRYELRCMCDNRTSIPGLFQMRPYWSSTNYSESGYYTGYYAEHFSGNCGAHDYYLYAHEYAFVKCVK